MIPITEFKLTIADMEGLIGDTAIDEAFWKWGVKGGDGYTDGDAIFALINIGSKYPINKYVHENIPQGHTFIARCVTNPTKPDLELTLEEDKTDYGIEYIPIWKEYKHL